MKTRQLYLLMKHLFRLERAYIDLDSSVPCRSQVILKWTNNPHKRINGHLIPEGSILITEANSHILKEAINKAENIILNHLRNRDNSRVRRQFFNLYMAVLNTTLESWSGLFNRPDRNDNLLDRWNYKRCFEDNGLGDLVTPEELIKKHKNIKPYQRLFR